MADAWGSLRLDEIDPIPVVNGTLLWRPIRRTLDIGAFGINAYVALEAGADVVEEHTESALGHEEVYIVLSGRATFTLGDEVLDNRPAPSSSSATRRSSGMPAPRSLEPRCWPSAAAAAKGSSNRRGRTSSPRSRSVQRAPTRRTWLRSRAHS